LLHCSSSVATHTCPTEDWEEITSSATHPMESSFSLLQVFSSILHLPSWVLPGTGWAGLGHFRQSSMPYMVACTLRTAVAGDLESSLLLSVYYPRVGAGLVGGTSPRRWLCLAPLRSVHTRTWFPAFYSHHSFCSPLDALLWVLPCTDLNFSTCLFLLCLPVRLPHIASCLNGLRSHLPAMFALLLPTFLHVNIPAPFTVIFHTTVDINAYLVTARSLVAAGFFPLPWRTYLVAVHTCYPALFHSGLLVPAFLY